MNLTNVCQIWKQELKMQKSRLESDLKERLIKLPLAVFFIFFRALLLALCPQRTERLEEAIRESVSQ